MNWITILGILVLIIGSIGLAFEYTIWGIIINAIGTFLIIYGPEKNTNKENKEIKDKLEEFGKKLENVKKENLTFEVKENKIEELENEFTEWAKNFISNQDEKKLEIEKFEINLREEKVKLNQKWRPFYIYFFENLIKIITAYNSANNTQKISIIENPSFPANIYNETYKYYNESKYFRIIVKFKDKLYWKIFLELSNDEQDIPKINLYTTDNPNESYFFNRVIIKPYPELNKIFVDFSRIFKRIELKEKYNLDSYSDSLNDILQKTFELQILILNET
jgi:hypothetical protein